MVLSLNETFASLRSGITPTVSYADAVSNKKKFITITKRSFLDNQPSTLDTSSTVDNIKIIQSRIWRHSLYQNGYIMEISKIATVTDYRHLNIVHSAFGIISQREYYQKIYGGGDPI
ncbi:hypothetical protein BDF21DRAFT_464321 [Thamnidium elegans]|nr:hypothetical protein BDF21DRAFT_464321 [Thamnidium elegans]